MDWAERAAAQGGIVSRAQLAEHGIPARTITRMAERGELRAVAAAVFLARGAPFTLGARLWAAHLATQGVLGFASAGHLWGVFDAPPGMVHVCVEHPRRSHAPGWVRLHRVPVAASAVVRLAGLPVTSRVWTVLDLIGGAGRDATRMADRALQRGWITGGDLHDRLRRYPGRTGNGALRRISTTLGDGAAAESERLLHRILRSRRIEGWQPNYGLWAGGELVAVLDVAFPDRRVAVEVDGYAFHSDVDDFRRDRRRQNRLVELGWTVLRFTWADLTERPGYVAATIRSVLRSGAQVDAC